MKTLIAFPATVSSSFRFASHDGVAHSCTIVLFRLQLCPAAVFPIDFVTVVQPSSYVVIHLELAAAVRLCRMALSPATRVTLGAVLGGLVGFYVVDRLEDDYKVRRCKRTHAAGADAETKSTQRK